jgi:tetratricopeptide (TPR) repeat protein
LVLAGTSVYSNSLSGTFLFDDNAHIGTLRDPTTGELRPWRQLVAFSSVRPTLTLSLAANYAWGGVDTTSYHLFNVTVHVVAGLALYGLVRRTSYLPALGGRFAEITADSLAFVAALLWIVHPLQTESVTYIVQRCESMMGMFFLFTMYAYVRSATSPSFGKWTWYSVAFVSYCLGLASKEVMVMVLPVLLVYDRVFLSTGWREVLRQRGWMFLAFAIPLFAAMSILPSSVLGVPDSTAGLVNSPVTPWEYAGTQPQVILHYLRLVVFPHPQCLDYGWPVESRWLYIVIPGAIVVGFFSVSIWMLARGWKIGFLGVAFLLVLAPTSSFFPIQDICSEHRMYLPLACVLLAAVLGAHELVRRLPLRAGQLTSVALVLGVALTWSGLTVARNRVYHEPLAMWMDVLQKTRDYRAGDVLARSLNKVAADLLREGYLPDSLVLFDQARLLCPPLPELESNFGRALMQLGNYQAARLHVEKAVKLRPDEPTYHHLLGQLCRKQGQPTEAEQHFRVALRLSPRDDMIKTDLAQCLADQNRTAEAIREFEQVLKANPDAADARHRLAAALASAGKTEEAIRQADELAKRSPEDFRPHVLFGLIETQSGQHLAALKHLQRALELSPREAAVYCLVGSVYRKLNNHSAAQQAFEQALTLNPNLVEAQTNLKELDGRAMVDVGVSTRIYGQRDTPANNGRQLAGERTMESR